MLVNLEPLIKDVADVVAALASDAQVKAHLDQAQKDLAQAVTDAAATQAKVDELQKALEAALAARTPTP